MLTEIDRVLLATPDAEAAAAKWRERLDAVEISRDALPSLGARRITMRAGTSDIELLEPDGVGAIETALKRRGRAHLYAAGAASPDPAVVAETARTSVAAEASEQGITVTVAAGPAAVLGDHGLLERMVGNLVENAVRHNTRGGWVLMVHGSSADWAKAMASGVPTCSQRPRCGIPKRRPEAMARSHNRFIENLPAGAPARSRGETR